MSKKQSSLLAQLAAQESPRLSRVGVWQTPDAVGALTPPVHTHITAPPFALHSPDPIVMGLPPTPQEAPSDLVPTKRPLHAVARGVDLQVVAIRS